MSRHWRVMPVIMTVALVLYPVIGRSTAVGAEKTSPQLTVKAGELGGTLTDTTGKALGSVTIKVLDRNDKTVAEAVTADDGKFSLKSVAAGNYTLSIGKEFSLKMVVSEKSEASKLVLLLPGEKEYSAGAPQGGVFSTKWVWIGLGTAVVAAAIVIPIAAHNSGGHHTRTVTVSP